MTVRWRWDLRFLISYGLGVWTFGSALLRVHSALASLVIHSIHFGQ